MGKRTRSRRSFLQASAGLASVAAIGSTAGCLDSVPFVGGGGQINAVPEDANGVMYADIDAIREDDGVKAVANAYYSAQSEYDWYDGPSDYEEALSDFEDETDLDPSGVHELVTFAGYGGEYSVIDSEYTAVIVSADWSADDIVNSLEDNNSDVDYDEDEHSGQTVYEPSEDYASYVGVLSDGQYVIGNQDAVEDAIDAKKGDDDGLDEEVRNAYSKTRSAPVRFASVMPNPSEYDSVPESYGHGDNEVDLGVLEDVTTVAGSIYKDGDKRGVEVTLTADDADTASNLADIVDGAISYAKDNTYNETAKDLLDDLKVSQNGSDVTISFEKSISDLEDLINENVGPNN